MERLVQSACSKRRLYDELTLNADVLRRLESISAAHATRPVGQLSGEIAGLERDIHRGARRYRQGNLL